MSENEVDNVLKRHGFKETKFNTVIQLPERNMSIYRYFYKENKVDCTYSTVEIKENLVILCFYCVENGEENMNKLNSNNGIFESVKFLNIFSDNTISIIFFF